VSNKNVASGVLPGSCRRNEEQTCTVVNVRSTTNSQRRRRGTQTSSCKYDV